jgi:hypothetical protein
MPGLDERIERALRESARSPDADPTLVARVVDRKRTRRQARRNAATGALVAAVLVTTAVVTVTLVRRDGGDDRRVSTPAPTTAARPADPVAAQAEIDAVLPGPEVAAPEYLSDTEAVVDMESARGVRVEYVQGAWQIDPASACRLDPATACGPPDVRVSDAAPVLGPDVYAAESAPVEAVSRPEDEYARGPVVSIGDASWVAVYQRTGPNWTFPPSHLLDLNSGRRIDLQGEILSFASGEDGTLWAVTRDEIVDTDGTEYRLKRIDTDGSVHSEPMPPGEQPAGPVATGAGGWTFVPVLDGLLRFDVVSGEYANKIVATEGQSRRGAAVIDGNAWVPSGTSLRRATNGGAIDNQHAVETGVTTGLTDVVLSGDSVWALGGTELVRLDRQMTAVEIRVPLPTGFIPTSLLATGDGVVVMGTADLAEPGDFGAKSVAVEPIVLVADRSGISSMVVIAGGGDTSVAFEPSGDLLVTSHGNLYRADLP